MASTEAICPVTTTLAMLGNLNKHKRADEATFPSRGTFLTRGPPCSHADNRHTVIHYARNSPFHAKHQGYLQETYNY